MQLLQSLLEPASGRTTRYNSIILILNTLQLIETISPLDNNNVLTIVSNKLYLIPTYTTGSSLREFLVKEIETKSNF